MKLHRKSVHEARYTNLMKWKIKLFEIEAKILKQKVDLTHKICRLKEKEFHENETCQCIGWCAISHRKHSWKKSIWQQLFHKFENFTKSEVSAEQQTCDVCELDFGDVNSLNLHIETHDKLQETNGPESEGDNVHRCEVCKYQFSNADNFILHMETNHNAADVKFLSWS